MKPRASRFVDRIAHRIEQEDKVLLSQPGSGRIYKRGNVSHQASAPGEPPAIDTSDLINSVHVEKEGSLTALVVEGAEYSADLEYGTTKMAPRPHLTPAVEKVRPEWSKGLKELFNV